MVMGDDTTLRGMGDFISHVHGQFMVARIALSFSFLSFFLHKWRNTLLQVRNCFVFSVMRRCIAEVIFAITLSILLSQLIIHLVCKYIIYWIIYTWINRICTWLRMSLYFSIICPLMAPSLLTVLKLCKRLRAPKESIKGDKKWSPERIQACANKFGVEKQMHSESGGKVVGGGRRKVGWNLEVYLQHYGVFWRRSQWRPWCPLQLFSCLDQIGAW